MLKILLAVLFFGFLFLLAIIAIAGLVFKKGMRFFRHSYHRSSSGWKYSGYGHHSYGHKHYRRKLFSRNGFFSS